jgi:hypothetical protein
LSSIVLNGACTAYNALARNDRQVAGKVRQKRSLAEAAFIAIENNSCARGRRG